MTVALREDQVEAVIEESLARQFFERGEIPKHPREKERKKWSESPCRYCDWKKFVCKPDYTDGITELAQSHGLEFGKQIREGFDYSANRAKVFARWGVPDPLKGGAE